MKGLRIQPLREWDDCLSEGREPFEYLFTPILSSMKSVFWFLDYPSYHSLLACEELGEDYVYSLYIDEGLEQLLERGNSRIDGYLMQPEFLPRLAKYVYTDHNSIVGLQGKKSDIKRKAAELIKISWLGVKGRRAGYQTYIDRFIDFLGEHALLYFNCYDGSWWDVYSPSPAFLTEIRQWALKMKGTEIQEIDLKILAADMEIPYSRTEEVNKMLMIFSNPRLEICLSEDKSSLPGIRIVGNAEGIRLLVEVFTRGNIWLPGYDYDDGHRRLAFNEIPYLKTPSDFSLTLQVKDSPFQENRPPTTRFGQIARENQQANYLWKMSEWQISDLIQMLYKTAHQKGEQPISPLLDKNSEAQVEFVIEER